MVSEKYSFSILLLGTWVNRGNTPRPLTALLFAVTIATVTIRLGLLGKGNRRYSSYVRPYARRESQIVGRKLCRRGLGCPHITLRGRCNISCATRRGCHRHGCHTRRFERASCYAAYL